MTTKPERCQTHGLKLVWSVFHQCLYCPECERLERPEPTAQGEPSIASSSRLSAYQDANYALNRAATDLAAAQAKLARYEALDQHLPPGFAIGDDATADLAIKLVETEARLAAAQKENLELLRQLGIQIKAWEGQSDLREEAETKLAAAEKELERLREWKKAVDIAWTAGMLAMTNEDLMGGKTISAHEFITSLKVAMRQAENKFMAALGEAQKG